MFFLKSKLWKKVKVQTLAEVFALCVNWKITLSFNLISQALSIQSETHHHTAVVCARAN